MNPKNTMPMLAVLFGAAFVASFNENIVNVGLPDIMATFAIDANTANWLVTGYMIISAIVITIVPFLMKRFTLRQVFVAAALLFMVGSASAMVAPSFLLLLACRLVQALGTGLFIPIMMNSVLALAPREKLGTFLSVGGCCITFGPALGPVMSGLMVTAFGWRTMFVVPLVVMGLLFVLGLALIRNYTQTEKATLDIPSVALSALGITVLVYGLSRIASAPVQAVVTIAVGVVVIAVFVVRQQKISQPLLDVSPFKEPVFCRACGLVIVAMMTTFSMSVLLPLFFETAFGMSALTAGLLLLMPIVINAGTAVIGGRIMDRRGEWPLLPIGFGIVVVGQAACALVAGSFSVVGMAVAASATYAGVGLIFSPSQTSGLKPLSHEQHPHGVSLLNTLVMVAAALGPSLFVSVFSNTMAQAGGDAASSALGFAYAVAIACAIAIAGFALSIYHARSVSLKERSVRGPATDVSPLRTIMKTDVFTLEQSQTIADALRLFADKGISGAPVVDSTGRLAGFLSDGDVMRHLADQVPTFKSVYSFIAEQGNKDFEKTLASIMQLPVSALAESEVVAVDASAGIGEVARVLSERHLKKVPVMEEGEMVGIINRSNVTKYTLNLYFNGEAGKGTVSS